MCEDWVCEKEKNKCNNIIKNCKKMINFGKWNNGNWLKSPDHAYRILIIEAFAPGK